MNKRRRITITFAAIWAINLASLTAKPKDVNPQLKTVRTIFVRGTNEAADHARRALTSNGCLLLAGQADAADGVLEIATDTAPMGGALGGLGRNWLVSATLTVRASGDLVWSKSMRQTDAPFMAGGKTSGKLLISYLAKDAGCSAK
jgi:hypothetical protein